MVTGEVSRIRLHRFLIIAFSSIYCTWHNFNFFWFIRTRYIILKVKRYCCLPWILHPIRFRFRLGLSVRSLLLTTLNNEWFFHYDRKTDPSPRIFSYSKRWQRCALSSSKKKYLIFFSFPFCSSIEMIGTNLGSKRPPRGFRSSIQIRFANVLICSLPVPDEWTALCSFMCVVGGETDL